MNVSTRSQRFRRSGYIADAASHVRSGHTFSYIPHTNNDSDPLGREGTELLRRIRAAVGQQPQGRHLTRFSNSKDTHAPKEEARVVVMPVLDYGGHDQMFREMEAEWPGSAVYLAVSHATSSEITDNKK